MSFEVHGLKQGQFFRFLMVIFESFHFCNAKNSKSRSIQNSNKNLIVLQIYHKPDFVIILRQDYWNDTKSFF